MSKVAENKAKAGTIKRMKYARGHIDGVIKMIEGDAYCMDIIHQNHAVIESLKKVNKLILEGYLGECAWDAMHSRDTAKRKKAIAEIIKLYK